MDQVMLDNRLLSEQAKPSSGRSCIGIFDSGVGGLTVLREVLQLRPDLDFIYFADSLNLPYGNRTPEQLIRLGHSNIEFLIERGASCLAVGCNSTSTIMGQGDLKSFGLPVFDLVSSTIDWLRVQHHTPRRIGLLGTLATVQSRYWERKLNETFPSLEILTLACPEFVPIIEGPQLHADVLRHIVQQRLEPLLQSGVRTLVHACTHYPWLERSMLEVCPELLFINPAKCLAERLCHSLGDADGTAKAGRVALYNSRPSEVFYRLASEVLGCDARSLTTVYIVNPYED
jgi:glutamate racemase